ncbi:DNA mismatch repair protein MutT [Sphingomonas panacis]|uniref:DNA mismatch repair protein MutT n=1 Tax=Sphingomonas panacis TaxID=1560345 RepID=A0A1B3Z8W3_9SPHN|nr:NUDIX domain-containing protein [Sphingomonas panacis]AOH83867.1 DNA mismatch repair protein MutT [Sphingomonas panacis]
MSAKGAERVPRPAARILLLDGEARILLFRFDPADRPPFWCTPGGAVDPGESYEAAARRELFEETGIVAEPGEEVARRVVDFVTLEGLPVTADERYFRIDAGTVEVDTSGHTPLEQRVMREWRWFSRDEIATFHEPIFPEDLLDMIATREAL